ncbi:WxL domain-containing protein [Companilactobacillus sp. DQM5]|uniref:WxL domain-containing protein n=1 Tax=Companilactobacillus sp. DQM5 TaxID=3463359 RepID=UPI004057FEC3
MKIKNLVITSATLLATLASTTPAMAANAVNGTTGTSDSDVTFTAPDKGALTLLKVSDLNFGSHPISAADETYSNENAGKVSVQDLRGSNEGWKVQVQQANEFKTSKGDLLKGAEITFNGSNAATGTTPATDAAINTGNAVDVWTAPKGSGNGVSNMDVEAGKSSLMVPGASTKLADTYTTTLNWTLLDSPANK